MQTLTQKTQQSLNRLIPRLQRQFDHPDQWAIFEKRLRSRFSTLFGLLLSLYGDQFDFFYHLESILLTAGKYFRERPQALRQLDETRPADWFQSEKMVGGVCYVDLYAGNLEGIRDRIPYFRDLRLTYLHLMPLFRSPPVNNDGGYAISSFREVNPALGTMEELAGLAEELRRFGISLVLDFVFNHTSDEHEWALKAKAGDPEYQEYYFMFPNRELPDQYERNLREIFPDQAPGNFTYLPEQDLWVWTTFNSYQWDLNYRNPAVFNDMLAQMLFLANQGAEVLRLDAVAFIWKQLGTTSENLPQAHDIIAAFRALVEIAAPAMIFKSEAIVHPDDVEKYLGRECQISYNPTFMVLLWEALATREVRLLRHSMAKRFALPGGAAWVNYVRSHDDIGWSFADEDAAELGINGYDHRQFLNAFYTGRYIGSFASGLPFNYNPRTGDMRISGTTASLAGLEKAVQTGDEEQIDLSIGRILLIESLSIVAGGIPLLYLGDELGTLNDYSYRKDPAKSIDSRWVHRPAFDPNAFEQRTDQNSISGRIFARIRQMNKIRSANPVFGANGRVSWLDTNNPHVLAFERINAGRALLVLANFSEFAQVVERRFLPAHDPRKPYIDLITGGNYPLEQSIMLLPYAVHWLSFS